MARRALPQLPVFEQVDSWLDRIQLVDQDDEAVAKFLDSLDLRGDQERKMLAELARRVALADPDGFAAAHRRAVQSLETLGRHGYHSAVLPSWAWPSFFFRWIVELIARYLVVSFLRQASVDMRNLYWLRSMQTEPLSKERPLLRRARVEAEGLMVVFKRREIGLPSFVLGGLFVPLILTLLRLAKGVSFVNWWATTVAGVIAAIVSLIAAWVVLRGAAMASRRIRLATRAPLQALWNAVGSAGNPTHDDTRTFVIVAIMLTTAAWFAFPAAVAIAILT